MIPEPNSLDFYTCCKIWFCIPLVVVSEVPDVVAVVSFADAVIVVVVLVVVVDDVIDVVILVDEDVDVSMNIPFMTLLQNFEKVFA